MVGSETWEPAIDLDPDLTPDVHGRPRAWAYLAAGGRPIGRSGSEGRVQIYCVARDDGRRRSAPRRLLRGAGGGERPRSLAELTDAGERGRSSADVYGMEGVRGSNPLSSTEKPQVIGPSLGSSGGPDCRMWARCGHRLPSRGDTERTPR